MDDVFQAVEPVAVGTDETNITLIAFLMFAMVVELGHCLFMAPRPISREISVWAMLLGGCVFAVWLANMTAGSYLLGLIGFIGLGLTIAVYMESEFRRSSSGY